jgi:Cu/Zn superoxide dismutase
MQQARTRRVATTMVAAALLLGAIGIPAIAQGGSAQRGDFRIVAAGHERPEGATLQGRAQIVRTAEAAGASGMTHVDVHVQGLRPGATYGVHLHNAPCSAANPGGGHYKHDPQGAVTPPNEAWPSSSARDAMAGITANAAGVARGRATAGWVADGRAVSVVIHAGLDDGGTVAGGPKLACADLG